MFLSAYTRTSVLLARATEGRFLSAYTRTWSVFIHYWQRKWPEHVKATEQLRPLFVPMDFAPNLVLNLVSHNLFVILLLNLAQFTSDFKRFAICYMVCPSLLGGLGFYYFKYGRAMFDITTQTLKAYCNNFCVMLSMAMVSWTMNLVAHCVVVNLVPFVPFLPKESFMFPLATTELYLKRCVIALYFLGALCFVAVPLWTKGYHLLIKVLGERGQPMPTWEAALELLYFLSQSTSALQVCVPTLVLLQNLGVRFYVLHVVMALLEVLIGDISSIKECVLHQLMHDIRPLYALTHAEHHICKGTYPTTAGFGLWQVFFQGNNIAFSLWLFGGPYLLFQISYTGGNLIIHGMFPANSLVMHHTLHHVINADIFGGVTPSPRDRLFSRDLKKHGKTLEAISPFCQEKYLWLNDLVPVALLLVNGLIWHYVLGWGIFSVLHEIEWR